MLLNYEQIRMDGGTQPRAELQKEVMEEYAELMRAGVKFPPLVVFHDGDNYWLADGFHRMGAALRAFPANPIEVEVIQGTLAEAQWYSFGVNKTHGLRRTPEDRKRIIKAALKHAEAAHRSDRELAEHIGVDHKTVAKYRSELKLESGGEIPQLKKRTGRDGKKYPAARPDFTTNSDGRIVKRASARMNRGKKKPSQGAYPHLRGHSLPNPMISLSLPPHNPAIAAATICNLFEPSFIKTLIEELTQRMKGMEE